ncbi:hypothetical protein AB4238_22365 [Shewanella sp. 10N.286.45.A1]|uniref:hypothetical protein n=1 Tax=Shewanella sp. 10N.286.45.A1 TaxID=3229694 RepID=UPI0035515187
MKTEWIIRKIVLLLTLVVITFVFGGMFYSVNSDVKVTIDNGYGSPIFISFIVVYIIGIIVFSLSYLQNKKVFLKVTKTWKSSYFIVFPIVYAALLSFSIFGAVPKILHNINSVSGYINLTVKEKINNNHRGRCAPRIIAQEVTFSINGHVCVSNSEFNEVQVGNNFITIGLISAYGFESVEIGN